VDPDACVRLIYIALADNKLDEARAHMEDLQEWIVKGGFLPDPSHLRLVLERLWSNLSTRAQVRLLAEMLKRA
jgi:hypothetical protein